MRPSYFFCAALALAACEARKGAAFENASHSVQVMNSSQVEDSDLMADGGSTRDPGDPFWQVVIDRSGIHLNGAASTSPPSMISLPPVRSISDGATETWLTKANGEPIKIEALHERCVRSDGFVFRQKVTVEVGGRVLVSCGERGSDPQPTKE
jgi:uncharacterized membrane protein